MTTLSPHENAPVEHLGEPLATALGAVVLLHGRGASAHDILSLGRALYDPRLAYLAPQAASGTWYPNSFMAPRAANEPWLSSALATVASTVQLALDAGIPTEQILIAGFSQGACLSAEFVATHPARYAGLIAFTGGLIGPPGSEFHHPGSLAGTPALFLSGDPDPHVPWSRILESAAILESMNARVTTHCYPGRSHTVSAEEITLATALLQIAFPPDHQP